ncbi:hypothetical protein BpHYR1_020917 [Brachionus plicatilis]|uniref:Uncharacterized protein n=1 Tax=Brachionus plicatilis TaxID=10195 RepID=A0A3M7QR50_BRAPC|nr:hypothetical protein BpHYR1_020917 [Brachionus plicatilis]
MSFYKLPIVVLKKAQLHQIEKRLNHEQVPLILSHPILTQNLLEYSECSPFQLKANGSESIQLDSILNYLDTLENFTNNTSFDYNVECISKILTVGMNFNNLMLKQNSGLLRYVITGSHKR